MNLISKLHVTLWFTRHWVRLFFGMFFLIHDVHNSVVFVNGTDRRVSHSGDSEFDPDRERPSGSQRALSTAANHSYLPVSTTPIVYLLLFVSLRTYVIQLHIFEENEKL